MNKSAPFARATQMLALIAAAMAAGEVFSGTYVSRGHGLGRYSGKKRSSSSGKYTQVFNGKRERARRVRQMALA